MSLSSLLLVGCGNMGGALLGAWLRQNVAATLTVIDPHFSTNAAPNMRVYASLDSLPETVRPEVVVLAVKPQTLPAILPHYASRFAAQRPLFLSIAAGKALAFFESSLGGDAAVIRAMPNLPAMVGMGITALCANCNVTSALKHKAEALMRAVGDVVWLEDEPLMDAATAISGSGPAYVFLFLEALIAAGVESGLAPEDAKQFVLATVRGSMELARQSQDTPAALRAHVTSPGGTTEAALGALMADEGLPALISKAVQRAIARARELA